MAIDIALQFHPDGTVSVGLTLVNLLVDIFKYALVSVFSVVIYKFYSVHSRWGEAMWLKDSSGSFGSLVASGKRVNGLTNFDKWHVTAIGFSSVLFALGFSGTLMTGLFSSDPHLSNAFDAHAVITAPIWNASYNASAMLIREDATNAASGFVHLLSGIQKLNISTFSTELDSQSAKFIPLKLYNSVATSNSATTMHSDYLGLSARSTCDGNGLKVEYQNSESGAFRGYSDCTTQQYGFLVKAEMNIGASSVVDLTGDSWGQMQWIMNKVPTTRLQQREILSQVNGSTIRISETYSTFDSVASTTFDISGIQKLCVSVMGVHRDTFDAGLCTNMTVDDMMSFQAMDLQYDSQNEAMLIRYCSVYMSQSVLHGKPEGYNVGCIDYILQIFSIQSVGIQDGTSSDFDVYFPTIAGSDMLSTWGTDNLYYVNITKAQNTVLQVNIASSMSLQRPVPNQATNNMIRKVTDFSVIHTDTRGVPAAQTQYTALLSTTFSDWQKPEVRAPVGMYTTAYRGPWIRTSVLGIALAASVAGLVLAFCIRRWFLSQYFTRTFMDNVQATAFGQRTPDGIFMHLKESDSEKVPACVMLNSWHLTLEYSEKGEAMSLFRDK